MGGKNILLIGSNSDLAKETIKKLKKKNYTIFATSRKKELFDENIENFFLNVTDEQNFLELKEKISNIEFDTIINFAGIAIAGAVEELDEKELQKQLDVNLFGLLRIIKYFCPYLSKNGKLVNVSSMASYGIFPFLCPYCISKSSADILLNLYSIESNIKVVSVRPGAIATKFWESSIELNKNSLKGRLKEYKEDDTQRIKFQKEKDFLVRNAQKNSVCASKPEIAASRIVSIIEKRNPKNVYNIGIDSKIAKISRFLPQEFINRLVKSVLRKRI